RFVPLVHRTIQFGEDLAMPASSDLVFWTMRCSLNSSGELRALLLRVPAVMMDVTEQDGRMRSFRVLLPVLASPSLGTSLPSDLAEFAQVFSERGDRNFSVAKLEFRSLGQPAYRNSCDVELLRALALKRSSTTAIAPAVRILSDIPADRRLYRGPRTRVLPQRNHASYR